MGSPPMNLLSATVESGALQIGGATVTAAPTQDGPVTVGVRPEHFELHHAHVDGMLPARVDFVEPLGSHVLVTVLVDGDGPSAEPTRVIVAAPAGTQLESGTRVGLDLPPERTYFFDAETGDARSSRERLTI